jgi:toxin ParE1/3/4
MLMLETSPEAEADLVDIWLYIANDQPNSADRFLDRGPFRLNSVGGS